MRRYVYVMFLVFTVIFTGTARASERVVPPIPSCDHADPHCQPPEMSGRLWDPAVVHYPGKPVIHHRVKPLILAQTGPSVNLTVPLALLGLYLILIGYDIRRKHH